MPGFLTGVQDGATGGMASKVKGMFGKLKGKSSKASSSSKSADDGDSGGFFGSGLTAYHKGGVVRKTGPARLKKGERVLTKKQAKKYRKRMSKG